MKKNQETNVFSFEIILRASPKKRNKKEHFFFLLLRNQAKTIRAIFLMYYEPLWVNLRLTIKWQIVSTGKYNLGSKQLNSK